MLIDNIYSLVSYQVKPLLSFPSKFFLFFEVPLRLSHLAIDSPLHQPNVSLGEVTLNLNQLLGQRIFPFWNTLRDPPRPLGTPPRRGQGN